MTGTTIASTSAPDLAILLSMKLGLGKWEEKWAHVTLVRAINENDTEFLEKYWDLHLHIERNKAIDARVQELEVDYFEAQAALDRAYLGLGLDSGDSLAALDSYIEDADAKGQRLERYKKYLMGLKTLNDSAKTPLLDYLLAEIEVRKFETSKFVMRQIRLLEFASIAGTPKPQHLPPYEVLEVAVNYYAESLQYLRTLQRAVESPTNTGLRDDYQRMRAAKSEISRLEKLLDLSVNVS